MELLGNYKIIHEVESTGEKAEFRFHSKSRLQGGATVTVSNMYIWVAVLLCGYVRMCTEELQ